MPSSMPARALSAAASRLCSSGSRIHSAIDRAPSAVSGGTGSADSAVSSFSLREAAAMEAVRISFSLARVMPTYSTRISSDLDSRLSMPDTASRAMVG